MFVRYTKLKPEIYRDQTLYILFAYDRARLDVGWERNIVSG